MIEQAVLTVITAPRYKDETADAFIYRVLHTERQQDQEAKAAAMLGTNLHDSIAGHLNGKPIREEFTPYLAPCCESLKAFGKPLWVENIVVGDGYAGTMDVAFEGDNVITVLDHKTTKSVPEKQSYIEHRMQTAAYAATLGLTGDKPIQTANLYISTVNPGEHSIFIQQDWQETYQQGFRNLFMYWCYANKYFPK